MHGIRNPDPSHRVASRASQVLHCRYSLGTIEPSESERFVGTITRWTPTSLRLRPGCLFRSRPVELFVLQDGHEVGQTTGDGPSLYDALLRGPMRVVW